MYVTFPQDTISKKLPVSLPAADPSCSLLHFLLFSSYLPKYQMSFSALYLKKACPTRPGGVPPMGRLSRIMIITSNLPYDRLFFLLQAYVFFEKTSKKLSLSVVSLRFLVPWVYFELPSPLSEVEPFLGRFFWLTE